MMATTQVMLNFLNATQQLTADPQQTKTQGNSDPKN